MSVVIRSQLTVAASRLLTEITEARQAIDTLPDEAASLLTWGVCHEQLNQSIQDCEKLLERWEDRLIQVAEDRLEAEERVFTEFQVNGHFPVNIIDRGKQARIAVSKLIDRLRVAHRADLPPVGGAPAADPLPPAAPADVVPALRYPPLQIPSFDGTDFS